MDKQNLKTFIDSYTSRIIELPATDITGSFSISTNACSKQDVLLLENIIRLQTEISMLLNKAKRNTINNSA